MDVNYKNENCNPTVLNKNCQEFSKLNLQLKYNSLDTIIKEKKIMRISTSANSKIQAILKKRNEETELESKNSFFFKLSPKKARKESNHNYQSYSIFTNQRQPNQDQTVDQIDSKQFNLTKEKIDFLKSSKESVNETTTESLCSKYLLQLCSKKPLDIIN